MFEVDLLINNAEAKATGGATFDRLNPMTGEVASRAAASSVEDAKRAVDAAAAAFPAWSETGPAARRALLNKAADLLGESFDECPDFFSAPRRPVGDAIEDGGILGRSELSFPSRL